MKTLDGGWFLSLGGLDKIDCKEDLYQCFVSDHLTNDP